MADDPWPFGELELAIFRKTWTDYMELLPQARQLWSELAEPFPDEDQRLRWLASPHRLLPDGVSPAYCVGAGRAEEALALVAEMRDVAFI